MIFQILFILYFGSQVSSARVGKETIVHFDLKGAAPRPAYFQQLLSTVSKLGATGVLIEWEDMFPFSGRLEHIKNGNAYSLGDTIDILEHASALGLHVIPLVQTLGHMEWILKTEEYKDLREDPRYPMVACIGDNRARELIMDMVNQVLAVHSKYPTPFFHIGADEVYQIGICDADKKKLADQFENSTRRMEFDHFRAIARNITGQSTETEVLMWFDELRSSPASLISEYSLDVLVTPVVWKYTADLDKDLPVEMWLNLSHSFSNVWGAGAFKGADGNNQYWNRVKPYVQNNKQWFLQTVKYSEIFSEFQGYILTGWQRYDHFASLCESFPVSMGSLAVSLKISQNFIIVESDAALITRILNCPTGTDLNAVVAGKDNCRFPGWKVRDALRDFIQLKAFHENSTWVHNRESGWLQSSQILLAASNPYNVDVIGKVYVSALKKLDSIIPRIRSSMNELYFDDYAEEFLTDYVMPFYTELSDRLHAIQQIDRKSSFRPRPWFPAYN